MTRPGPGHAHRAWPAWYPEPRCGGCGHRIPHRSFASPDPEPVRRLGWRLMLAELPMRWAARRAFRISAEDRPAE